MPVARTGAGPTIGDRSMRVLTGRDVRRWGLTALALVALGAAARAFLVRVYAPQVSEWAVSPGPSRPDRG
ncbi:hypothetical protein Raf01_23430 [Rugosimonospora africana]|uniref:Uncharacterized protein n=2 Tax=Rugosimonospora africana TaxID=556532 RepID=A0A8J3VQ77_9ACTN|nr:hypothetical protein Raf01_23430 [Rugosimonospora africana]